MVLYFVFCFVFLYTLYDFIYFLYTGLLLIIFTYVGMPILFLIVIHSFFLLLLLCFLSSSSFCPFFSRRRVVDCSYLQNVLELWKYANIYTNTHGNATTMNDSHLFFMLPTPLLSPEKKQPLFIHFAFSLSISKKCCTTDDVIRRLRKKNAMPLWSYCAYMTYGWTVSSSLLSKKNVENANK